MAEIIGICLVTGILSAIIGSAKGRSGVGWFLIGFLFGILGFIVACVMPSLKKQAPQIVYMQAQYAPGPPIYSEPLDPAHARGDITLGWHRAEPEMQEPANGRRDLTKWHPRKRPGFTDSQLGNG